MTGAWVRLAAVSGRPAAGYLTLRGGATDQTLIAVASPAAGRIELHETMRHGPGMTMAPIGQVKVAAGAQVGFAPGGKHLMLFDVTPAIRPGSKLPLTFTFADGRVVKADAAVIAAGDAPPGR